MEADIILGRRNRQQGLVLLGEVTGVDGHTTPAHEAGRECRRFRHRKYVRSEGGWARGKTRRVEVATPGMYFRLAAPQPGPAYVTVEYLDRGIRPFTLTRGGEEAYGALLGTDTWQTFTARLAPGAIPQPYDLAICCGEPMWIARVAISSRRPAGYRPPAQAVGARARAALATPRPRIAVPVGNIGGIMPAGDEPSYHQIASWLPIYRALGVTSVQSYVRWSLVEPEPGKLDWSFYDRAVELLARHGMRWVAFVMIGPSYAVPEWFHRSEHSLYVRCLEHDQACPVQSIWNPHLLDYVDRFFGLLAERYGGSGTVESLMLGPSGDYGETTYNATFGGRGEDYHTHLGYWCGDDCARADLARHLEAAYGTLDALNRAWGTRYQGWSQVQPFLPAQAPSRQAEIDFNDWYVGSMTRWSKRWAAAAARHFPGVPIYHAAGGSGDPIHGGDWAEQAKAAAPHGVGLRMTNEGTPYPFNFIYTRWAATACRHYGAPFGTEPWGGDASGVGNVGRLYNAVSSGADQFWLYAGHLGTPECIEAFRRHAQFLRREQAVVDVAVYYPKLHFALTDEHAFAEGKPRSRFWAQGEQLRDITDFDLVDSTLIADGALERCRFLVLLQGTTMRRAALQAIEAWVEAGGVLILPDFGPIQDEAGRAWAWQRLLRQGERVLPHCLVRAVGRGATAYFPRGADRQGRRGDHRDHPATRAAFLRLVSEILRHPQAVRAHLPPRLEGDGEMDGVFATRLPDAILYLNTNPAPVAKRISGGRRERVVEVPGFSILRAKL